MLSWAGAELKALMLVPETATAYLTFWQLSQHRFTAPPEISWLCRAVSGSKHKCHCCLTLWFLGKLPKACFPPCFVITPGGPDFCFSVGREALTVVCKIQPGAYAARPSCSPSKRILLPQPHSIRTQNEKQHFCILFFVLYLILHVKFYWEQIAGDCIALRWHLPVGCSSVWDTEMRIVPKVGM